MAVDAACSFCGSSQPVLPCDSLVTGEAGTAHYFCLLFSSGLEQRGGEGEGIRGFLAPDIRRELRRGQRLKCRHALTVSTLNTRLKGSLL